MEFQCNFGDSIKIRQGSGSVRGVSNYGTTCVPVTEEGEEADREIPGPYGHLWAAVIDIGFMHSIGLLRSLPNARLKLRGSPGEAVHKLYTTESL